MEGEARMPVLFVGHGSPMNAIRDNAWSRGFQALGRALPKPRAVLAVSAHWFVPGTLVTTDEHPITIHDFGGFPDELFAVRYPAPGDPTLAQRVAGLTGAAPNDAWGLDHGTWSVLRHVFPAADVPVVQLSIDRRLTAAQHLELGRRLAPLRDEGVLVLGSGNITHDLRHALPFLDDPKAPVPDWAASFDADVAAALTRHDTAFLAKALDTDAGRRAHPTPDHYLPLLYAAGASRADDVVGFPIQGFDASSLSMRTVQFR